MSLLYLSTAGSKFKTVNDIYISGGFHPSVVGSFTSNMKYQNISTASLPTANGIAAVSKLLFWGNKDLDTARGFPVKIFKEESSSGS